VVRFEREYPPVRPVHIQFGAVTILCTGLLLSCGRNVPDTPSSQESLPKALAPVRGMPWFEEISAASGIGFQHFDASTDLDAVPERMGSGVAWIDYDNDGWPDLFCVQDGPLRPGSSKGPLPTCKLYRNNGDGTFTDVTEKVGLTRTGIGFGCAVGDYDNDGFDDLLVTYLGGVVLYHNEPDGQGGRRFVDVTARAGLNNPHFATSCAWGDIDGDGFLDLYICNYVEVDVEHYQPCIDPRTRKRMHCSPTVFTHTSHRLYRNNGNGTFTDISPSSGIASAPLAPGLGVIMIDLDGDGLLDIFVANDKKPAYLFHNQGNGRFVEKGLLSGCALGSNAETMAGMGVAAGDIDGSGRPSLFVTDFYHHGSDLFRNRGGLNFQDWSNPSSLGPLSMQRLGFGAVFLDADLDGRLDVAVANGHVYRNAPEVDGGQFAQQAQLFLGDGQGRFREVSLQAGPYFQQYRVGRGLACADYDNDGRPDLVFNNNAGALALLHNLTETKNHWIRLELVGDGKKSNRNAIGARVEIEAGGKTQTRWITGGGSFLSASERRLLIGLESAQVVDRVRVTWPSGRKQIFENLPAERWWRLCEGEEKAAEVHVRRLR
jgi:enediyne biosynthesis protein E4